MEYDKQRRSTTTGTSTTSSHNSNRQPNPNPFAEDPTTKTTASDVTDVAEFVGNSNDDNCSSNSSRSNINDIGDAAFSSAQSVSSSASESIIKASAKSLPVVEVTIDGQKGNDHSTNDMDVTTNRYPPQQQQLSSHHEKSLRNKTMNSKNQTTTTHTGGKSAMAMDHKKRHWKRSCRLDASSDDSADTNDDDDDENDQEQTSQLASVSLEAMKEQILGRKLISTPFHGNTSSNNNNNHYDYCDYDHTDHQQQQEIPSGTDPLSTATTTTTQLALSKSALRKDLTCPICHEIYFEPISLLCGHSFCQTCIDWWFQQQQQQQPRPNQNQSSNGAAQSPRSTCPSCRQGVVHTTTTTQLSVNRALQSCVAYIFPLETQRRIQVKHRMVQASMAGENNGCHNDGYRVVVTSQDDTWTTIRISNNINVMNVRRSIVMDANDQRMRLCLALVSLPITTTTTTVATATVAASGNNNTTDANQEQLKLQLDVCILHMEEDEMEDNNLPWIVANHIDDEQFISTEERFVSSPMYVTAIFQNNGTNNNNNDVVIVQPIVRSVLNDEGSTSIVLDISSNSNSNSGNTVLEYYCVRHEETGCELHVQPPMSSAFNNNTTNNSNNKIVTNDPPTISKWTTTTTSTTKLEREENLMNESRKGYFYDEDEDDDEDEGMEQSDDNDSFIAPSDDDDDVCFICNDGGHMIVCDGGDQFPDGCGEMFHLDCIGRTIVPPGDWICQDCTNDNLQRIVGLHNEVGIEGYEFPPVNATIRHRKRLHIKEEIVDTQSDNDFCEVHSPTPEVLCGTTMKKMGKENDNDHSRIKNERDINETAANRAGKRKIIVDSDDE